MAQRRSLLAEFKERFEEQVGECLGLEQAAQKAVDDLASRELLEGVEDEIRSMYDEAHGHGEKFQSPVHSIRDKSALEEHSMEEFAEGTARKATKIMAAYLGEKPQKLDALGFLCLAESHTFPGLEQACFISKEKKHLQCSKVYLATRKNSSPALHKAFQAGQHGLKPPERK
jgi:hypothetical protein